eukprot:9840048-Lingulodinium_polyedra.AAC.1
MSGTNLSSWPAWTLLKLLIRCVMVNSFMPYYLNKCRFPFESLYFGVWLAYAWMFPSMASQASRSHNKGEESK